MLYYNAFRCQSGRHGVFGSVYVDAVAEVILMAIIGYRISHTFAPGKIRTMGSIMTYVPGITILLGILIMAILPENYSELTATYSHRYREFTTVYQSHSREFGIRIAAKATFIEQLVFGKPFRVLTNDRFLAFYCAKLSEFFTQYRTVGVNYNLVVKELESAFSEKTKLMSYGLGLNN